MSSRLVVNQIQDSNAKNVDTTFVTFGSLKATVKANASATTTAAASLNISGSTDHGGSGGDFSYNLTSAYASVNSYVQTGIQEGASHGYFLTRNTGRHTASIIAVECSSHAGALTDISQNIMTAGELA